MSNHNKNVLHPYYAASGGVSLLSSLFVIVTYMRFHEVRKHPSSLIFWRSVLDLVFNAQFIVLVAWDGAPDHCGVLSVLFQFTVLGTQSYYVMIALDLFLALRDPFTNSARNLKFYHAFVWGASTLTCVVMVAFDGTGYRTGMEVCWIKQTDNFGDVNLLNWFLFFIPTLCYYMISVGIMVMAWLRLTKGLAETFKIRSQVLKNGQRYVTIFCVYWTAAAIFYFYIYLLESDDANVDAEQHMSVYAPFAVLLGVRGFIDVVVWVVNQQVVNTYRRHMAGAPATDGAITDINKALRQEVILFSTQGIAESVNMVSAGDARLPTHGDYPSSIADFDAITCLMLERDDTERLKPVPFFDYAPLVFKYLRRHLQIGDADYIRSILGNTQMMVEKFTEGASGSFFYFSTDGQYIVKTLSRGEAMFLVELLPSYTRYVCDQPDSLINKYVGFHAVKLYTYTLHFVVMQSVFLTPRTIHQRYDIKGSWVDRHGKGGRVVGSILKDNDLKHRVSMRARERTRLLAQLEHDTRYLCDRGIMDYSLLLGVHNTRQLVVRPQDRGMVDDIHTLNLRRVPFYQEFDGGLQANIIVGPGVYFFGIIDILQAWDVTKKCERCLKVWVRCDDAAGLSAIQPHVYRDRFLNAMLRITEAEDDNDGGGDGGGDDDDDDDGGGGSGVGGSVSVELVSSGPHSPSQQHLVASSP